MRERRTPTRWRGIAHLGDRSRLRAWSGGGRQLLDGGVSGGGGDCGSRPPAPVRSRGLRRRAAAASRSRRSGRRRTRCRPPSAAPRTTRAAATPASARPHRRARPQPSRQGEPEEAGPDADEHQQRQGDRARASAPSSAISQHDRHEELTAIPTASGSRRLHHRAVASQEQQPDQRPHGAGEQQRRAAGRAPATGWSATPSRARPHRLSVGSVTSLFRGAGSGLESPG